MPLQALLLLFAELPSMPLFSFLCISYFSFHTLFLCAAFDSRHAADYFEYFIFRAMSCIISPELA
jgi:hypothetical protein